MLPDWLQVVVLGVVQGLTEFIPVSSSAHLVLVPYLGGFDERSLAFDVWLHAGTLLAVLLYFRQELLAIARGLLRLDTSEQGVVYRRVGLLLVPASVPVAAVGVLLKPLVADASEDPLLVSLLLLLTAAILTGLERVRAARVRRGSASTADAVEVPQGALQPAGARPASPMWRGDWRGAAPGGAPAATAAGPVALPLGDDAADPLGTTLRDMRLRHAMAAGLMQAVALLPGVSRSGSTIAGGVVAGLTREAATRFSFLLSIPVLVGAIAVSLPDLSEGGDQPAHLALGVVASFVAGYAAIRFLVALVSRERLTGFAGYCVAASVVGLVGYLVIGPPSAV